MSTAARTAEPLFASLVYLGGARISVLFMNLLATSHLAHALGISNFGLNSFAISYLSYFMILVDMGYETFLTRDIARDAARLRRLVNSMISMRLMLAAGSSLLLLASLSLLDLPPLGQIVVLIQGLNLFSAAIGLTCVYRGLQRMRLVAGREFIASFTNVVGILWLVQSPGDVVAAACVSAGTFAVMNIAILMRYWTDFGRPRVRFPRLEDVDIAKRSMVYFWSVLMITITYNMHIVLLGLMRDAASAGLFASAWKLFNFANVLPNLIATVFLPRIANLSTQPTERMRTTTICMQVIIVCAVPITLFGMALTSQILALLFGPAYVSASSAFCLLMLDALVVSMNIVFGLPLVAVGRQKAYLQMMAIGTGVGVVFNVALIPYFGATGAAAGSLANELMILILFAHNRPEVPVQQTVAFGARCLVAGAPAAFVAHCASMLTIINGSDIAVLAIGGAAGSVIYLLTLGLMRINILNLVADLRHLR